MSLFAYSPETVFAGEVARVSVRGSVVRARCLPGGSGMDQLVPRMRLQPGCNHSLFSPGCGLSAEDWLFTSTVQDPGSPGWPFVFVLENLAWASGGPLPTFFPEWFAGGLARFGSGSASRTVPIVRSGPIAAGVVALTLSRDPSPFPVIGQSVSLWPGCDGRAESCRTYHATTNPEGKFGNWLNFG
ncbi:MAG: phage BR0599 family protein, partial [Verrucomicrobiota bacterium]